MRKLIDSLTPLLAATLLMLWSASASAFPVKYANEGDVPDDVRDAIVDRMPEEPDAESELHARRQARRAAKIAAGVLNAYGYFDPKITRSITGEGANARPFLDIDPGAQFVIDRLVIRYQGDHSPLDTLQEEASNLGTTARSAGHSG